MICDSSIYTIERETEKSFQDDDQRPVKLKFFDLKETVLNVINFMGRYQYAICAALIFNGMIYGINHFVSVFYVYTPTFYCKENNDIPNSCDALNGTCPSGFRFEQDDRTIVTEWSLVCANRLYAPLANTLYYSGVTIGAITHGILADKFGRKKILLICIFSQGLIGLLLRTITVFEVFVVMRTVQGFFVQGVQGCSIALMFEYSPIKRRYHNIIFFHITANCAAILLTLASYGIRDWHDLQIIMSIPTLIIICYIWCVPESILWLMSTNRKFDALQLCLKTAKLNRDHEMINKIVVKYETELSANTNCLINEKTVNKTIIDKATLIDIVRTKCLRRHLIIMAFVNYSVTFAYYGNLFFINHLPGNRHLNYLVSNSIEVLSYGVIFHVAQKLGTRRTQITLLYLTAIFSLFVGITTTYLPDTLQWKSTLCICLTLIAKSLAGQSFTIKVLYNAELFPTICRGAALGSCGFFARIGSVIAPYLMILAEYYSPIVPLSIISTLTFLSATLVIFLPSTKNINLPQTIGDAKILWDKL